MALDVLVDKLMQSDNHIEFFGRKSKEEIKKDLQDYQHFYSSDSGDGWLSLGFGALNTIVYDTSTPNGVLEFKSVPKSDKPFFTLTNGFGYGVIEHGKRESYEYIILGWQNLERLEETRLKEKR